MHGVYSINSGNGFTMFNVPTRRNLLRAGATGAGAFLLSGNLAPVRAAEGRVLQVSTLASAAAVNVPMQAALRNGLGQITGFANADVRPTAKIPEIVQEVIAGSTDIGDADIASTLAAAEAGADIKIIGLSYDNTSQCIVANSTTTKSLQDVANRGGTIAVNSIGDFMYVMILGVLDRHGIPVDKINFVEMGSSGDRARALLAGRVDAVPMHIEQAEELKRHGPYEILVRPWNEYEDWFSAVTIASGKWLRKDENKAAAVALIKSVLLSFRAVDSDYAAFRGMIEKYASSKDLRSENDDFLKPVWNTLTREIKTFPVDMASLTTDRVARTLPVYVKAQALTGKIDLARVIDRTYLDQALKELA